MVTKKDLDTSKVIEKLLNNLGERSRDIIEKRFGLKKGLERHTLESIGRKYGVTRERVRQIENAAKKVIVETKEYKKEAKKLVDLLKKEMDKFGGVISEKEFLSYLTDDRDLQDHLHFLLHIGEPFFVDKKKDYEDKVWYSDPKSYEAFEHSLEKLYKDLENDKLLTEKEIIEKFTNKLSEFKGVNKKLLENDTVKRLLKISKKIASNDLGQWGPANSRNINTKGVRDYAYLILNQEKKPMHFKELAKEISEKFNKKVNVATIHNELIKDDRFILVGRGLYALDEWGKYSAGTVLEVITDLLKKSKKALTKQEIIKAVMEKKEVKEQTIIINLSNSAFTRTKDGKYKLAKK